MRNIDLFAFPDKGYALVSGNTPEARIFLAQSVATDRKILADDINNFMKLMQENNFSYMFQLGEE